MNHGGNTNKKQNIENVATHDIAKKHVGVVVSERRNGNC